MANKNFKITLRRRLPDGSLESAVFKLEHLFSTGGDEEQGPLLFDAETQANASAYTGGGRAPVRVWVEELDSSS